MRLLYLSTWDFKNEHADGVCKKINAHIAAFEKREYQVDFIYVRDEKLLYRVNGIEQQVGTLGKIKKIPAYRQLISILKNAEYDCVYNRYGLSDPFYNYVIKKLKKNGARIFVEVPSYPYECEREKGVLEWGFYKLDAICRKSLKKYVEKIITYMDYSEIVGIPTVRLINGIDISKVKAVTNYERDKEAIHLLIVTLMMRHHGFERIIEGLHLYYQNGGMRNIQIDFVGDGRERSYYESLVNNYQLGKQIIFHGMKGGDELDIFYEKADFGVAAMGLYKDNIFLTSELKSREYLAKGLPIISGAQIDLFVDNPKWFYLKFPENDTPIDMDSIISLYDQMVSNKTKQEVIREIRTFVEEKVDMYNTFLPLFKVMESKEH